MARLVHLLRRCRRTRAWAGLLFCVTMGVGYLAAASEVAFGLHIGHVVQDGVDTGDILALPLVVMATVCFGLALVCADGLGPRRRRAL